ncbi:MAG TPA: hypothetical protein PKA63_13205 [Oligoflexia bacterium]|nr:hypothetical protein [Oligoflexia bacterium]HMP49618.1 hypothetical protein [Oligoflexia bacterium]
MSVNGGHAKKVLGFLVCAPAFTKRNMTSMALVGVFFFVYILAGGKIDTQLPSNTRGGAFGGVDAGDENGGILFPSSSTNDPGKVLGHESSAERRIRENSGHMKGRIFTDDEADQAYEDPIDRSRLLEGREIKRSSREERTMNRYEKRKVDPLDAIQERLRKSAR